MTIAVLAVDRDQSPHTDSRKKMRFTSNISFSRKFIEIYLNRTENSRNMIYLECNFIFGTLLHGENVYLFSKLVFHKNR